MAIPMSRGSMDDIVIQTGPSAASNSTTGHSNVAYKPSCHLVDGQSTAGCGAAGHCAARHTVVPLVAACWLWAAGQTAACDSATA